MELVSRLDAAERRARLSAKTRHNFATMAMTLGVGLLKEFVAIYALAYAADHYGWRSLPAISAALALVAAAFSLDRRPR